MSKSILPSISVPVEPAELVCIRIVQAQAICQTIHVVLKDRLFDSERPSLADTSISRLAWSAGELLEQALVQAEQSKGATS